MGEKEMKLEKVPLLLVFKEDGRIKTDVSIDCDDLEMYGFLSLYLDQMKDRIKEDIIPRTDGEEII